MQGNVSQIRRVLQVYGQRPHLLCIRVDHCGFGVAWQLSLWCRQSIKRVHNSAGRSTSAPWARSTCPLCHHLDIWSATAGYSDKKGHTRMPRSLISIRCYLLFARTHHGRRSGVEQVQLVGPSSLWTCLVLWVVLVCRSLSGFQLLRTFHCLDLYKNSLQEWRTRTRRYNFWDAPEIHRLFCPSL